MTRPTVKAHSAKTGLRKVRSDGAQAGALAASVIASGRTVNPMSAEMFWSASRSFQKIGSYIMYS